MTISIRPYLPFELVYSESFLTEQEAINREKYFKTSAGRRFLKTKLALKRKGDVNSCYDFMHLFIVTHPKTERKYAQKISNYFKSSQGL